MNLQGKRALVTGAARGIGRGIALALAKNGVNLVLNDLLLSPDLEITAEEARAHGVECTIIRESAFNFQLIPEIVHRAEFELGGLDILVSNPAKDIAGYVTTLGPFDFMEVLQATVGSHFAMGQAVAKRMIQRSSGGRMVFTASVYGRLNRKKHVGYDCAKAALEQMMRVFARELAEHNINVNAIVPGFTDTPGERRHGDEAKLAEIAGGLPFGRGATPEEVGEMVTHIIAADYMTGSSVVLDGGMSLADYTYSKEERK